MSRRWMRQRERGSPFLIRLIARITLVLGRPAGRLLLHPISAYFLLFSGPARRASQRYLPRALGRPAGTADLYRHLHVFAATILDRVYLLSGRQDHFDVTMQGEQILLDQLTDGRGCLLLGSHLGSFEVLRALAQKQPDLRVRPMMYPDNAGKVNAVLDALNPELAAQVIPIGTSDSLLRVKEAVDAGDVVGILGDRIALDDKSVSCHFLGHDARFPAGPLLLAGLLQVPVVLFFGLYRGGKRYHIHFELLTPALHPERERRMEMVAHWTRRYAERLEQHCREAPYNWFNFYDFWNEDETADRLHRTAATDDQQHDT